ncbi:MAG TPA: UDP-N-acetylglucosamine 2-epimerase (non-hydrolyzing) [Sphingobacteriaceae bacterium]|nr:UDP-N-acetylglucosamine 2-epimerase (non-hydrolyzing) [Sphingobacteriaceae bacterium]
MKVVTIVGARPQFVKAAVISREFKNHDGIREIIVHTGQHYDDNMSKIFFDEMEIPYPQINLNINGLSHGAMTGQMLEGIEKVLLEEKPDWVLVYGDTNSTLAGALAAKKLHIKVAHVEAGLRSFNMAMPEEINRILTDRISDILFCPTESAIKNLMTEGFARINCKVIKTGDVMKDAADYYIKKVNKLEAALPPNFYLATIHREENTNDSQKLEVIFSALNEISKFTPIVMPIHPRTRQILINNGFDFKNTNIRFLEPVGYLEMIQMIERSDLVITDSGGLQKEAYFFNKNCVTIRDETEWVELIEAGHNILSPVEKEQIIASVYNMAKKTFLKSDVPIYGDGDCAKEIVTNLLNF